LNAFNDFITLIKQLRSPGGCPWDIEQTFQSLKPYVIEEAYELFEALKNESPDDLKEELGDVLLHIVMLSNMAEEKQWFSIDHVIQAIHKKMIDRHPHVFGETAVSSSKDVKHNWDLIKEKTRPMTGALDSIPTTLPALLQAFKIQKRASKKGFDWENDDGPLEKLQEEIVEFQDALKTKDENHIFEEAGDIIFSVVNILRRHNINPEFALKECNEKFISRYKKMESYCNSENLELKNLSLEEKEKLWERAKNEK